MNDVSIIIPSYNYARFLPQAVGSALAQNGGGCEVEVIIVDDGSTDDTSLVVRDMAGKWGERVRYIHQENQGLSAARNTGIRAAEGNFLLFLDADDLLGGGCVASQLDNFQRHPELDISVCLSMQAFTDESGRGCYLWPLRAEQLDMHICNKNISPVHTFLLRAEAARDVGFFDAGLKACEDQDYWLRCAALGKRFGVNVGGLVIYRMHGDGMTRKLPTQLAHGAMARFRVGALLRSAASFPRAGKFFGWLAHAAGTMTNALSVYESSPELGLKLLEEAARAVLLAGEAPLNNAGDPHLSAARRYFAGRCLLLARAIEGELPGVLQEAVTFLKERYPQFAAMDDAGLDAKTHELDLRLCCDCGAMLTALDKQPEAVLSTASPLLKRNSHAAQQTDERA